MYSYIRASYTRGEYMKKSGLIPLSIIVIMITAALSFSASAACSTCSKEEDWTLSATSFLEGIPINETPQDFGPKAARMTNSQFEKESEEKEEMPKSTAIAAPAQAEPAANTDSAPTIVLVSINADPVIVTTGSSVNITAVFGTAGERQNAGDNNSASDSQSRITASATIRNSSGINSGNVVLIKSSGNEYTGIWNASVLPGKYSVSISAASLQGSETFNDALQINVLESVLEPALGAAVENQR